MTEGPLKIAVVGACPFPASQGSQVYLKDTALALQALGHEPRMVVYGYGQGDPPDSLPLYRARNVPGARRMASGPSLAKPIQDVFLVQALRRLVRREGIGLIDAHNYEGLLVALAARAGPVLYHAHNAMADELPYFLRPKAAAKGFGLWLDRTFPKRAAHVVAPHRRLRDYLVALGCDETRVTVVTPWADQDLFTAGDVKDARPAILYTGNLDAYQNLPLLWQAMEKVREREPGAELIVATSSPAPIKGARVIPVHDGAGLAKVLQQDVVAVCPRVSWSGFPIKVLNTMAAGKAVVCCEGSAHIVEDGRNGLVVADNDPEEFAHAILRLMEDRDLRATLGAAARETAKALSGAETLGRVIEDLRVRGAVV